MSLYCQFKAVKYGLLYLFIILSLVKAYTRKECNLNVKLKLNLHNDGFHRNLTYSIVFGQDVKECWVYDECALGLDQMLPAGLYVNSEELNDLREEQKLNAMLKNPTNTELPAEQAYPTKVLLIGRVVEDKVDLWLPLHARYHLARAGGGKARNVIEPPKVFLFCPGGRLNSCNLPLEPATTALCDGSPWDLCDWRPIPFTLLSRPVSWETPVGDTNHYVVVGPVTALVVVIGSFYLMWATHKYNVNVKWKQS